MTKAKPPRIAPTDGLSHVIGLNEPPLVDETIPDFLAATVGARSRARGGGFLFGRRALDL